MDNENAVAKWNKYLGWLVLATSAFTAVSIVVLHGLQPDLNPFERAISEYVLGQHGSLMTVTFFSQAIASVALAALLMREIPGRRRIRVGGSLLMVAAVGAVVAGLFPADPASPFSRTTAGAIHMAGGLVRFLTLAFALPLLSAEFRSIPLFSTVAKALTAIGTLFVITFLVSIVFLANMNLFGLGQRMFIAILLIWMSIAAFPFIRRSDA